MSALDDLFSLELQKIWDGVHARLLHGERITLGVVELDPGSHVPEHQHENEQLGMCLSGSLVFRVGDETRDLGPGGTWSIPSNVPHDVQVGPEGAVVFDVFVPPRDDWREAERAHAPLAHLARMAKLIYSGIMSLKWAVPTSRVRRSRSAWSTSSTCSPRRF